MLPLISNLIKYSIFPILITFANFHFFPYFPKFLNFLYFLCFSHYFKFLGFPHSKLITIVPHFDDIKFHFQFHFVQINYFLILHQYC